MRRNRSEHDKRTKPRGPRPRQKQLPAKAAWWRSSPLKVVAAALAFFGGFPALLLFYSSSPTVRAPQLDPSDVFRIPFTVSNPHFFFTLYRVHPTCGFGNSPGFPVADMTLDAVPVVGDIAPGETRPTTCPVEGVPLTGPLFFVLELHYCTRFLPGICWPPRTKTIMYQVRQDAFGRPYWSEGVPLGENPK
jgi:hypothetical protein